MELVHLVIILGAEDCQFEYFQRIWSIRTDLQPTMWVPHSCTAMLEVSARRWVSTSRTWRSRSLTQVLAMAALAGSLPAFLTPWPLLDWLGPQNLSPFFAKLTPNLVPATDMASDMSTESLTKGWKMELRFWVLEFY